MNAYRSIPRRLRLAKPRLFAFLVFLFTLAGCAEDKDYRPPSLPVGFDINTPMIVRFPPADSWLHAQRPLKEFWRAPKWGPTSRDLRQADLSHLNLTDQCQELLKSTFDTETKWPDSLPQGFEPGQILEINKNPGLGIRGLHKQGYTGKGIGVAIIDRPLLVNHRECRDRIRYYSEVNVWPPGRADFHGAAVASVLGGRDCGVAPEVDIYFVGSYNFDVKKDENGIFVNSTHTARALDLICEINARLPVDKKIRVVSISAAWGPYDPGNEAMKKAAKRTIESGIFVVSDVRASRKSSMGIAMVAISGTISEIFAASYEPAEEDGKVAALKTRPGARSTPPGLKPVLLILHKLFIDKPGKRWIIPNDMSTRNSSQRIAGTGAYSYFYFYFGR